jgi:adenylate cyclase
MGISLGEVVIADGTVTGGGVVMAQRLEQLAEPGGVVVQGTVSETVPVRLPFSFTSLGEQNLKGFEQPVRAFTAVKTPGGTLPEPEFENAGPGNSAGSDDTASKPALPEKNRPSIAVLPFTNMSGDPEQEFFSDGITEDIITEFARFNDLFVIARNSSFVFKNQSVDITEAGQKLGVEYVVEGSVRKSGNRARITAQLIDVSTGSHIWANRYDRELEDIFEVQDEVVKTITSTLVGRVTNAYRDRAQQKASVNMDAYDWLVQGRELFYNGVSGDNFRAIEMFEKAISLDPDYAAAYALLAEAYIRDWATFWKFPPSTSHDMAWENAKKALTLDDTDSKTHSALGVVNLFAGEINQAFFHLDRALSLNPSDTHALIYMSRCESMSGNTDSGIQRVTEARNHNPFGKYDWHYAPAFYVAHRYSEAIEVMRSIQNPAPYMLCWKAAAHAQIGDNEVASHAISTFIESASENLLATGTPLPENWVDFISERWRFAHATDRDHFHNGLIKAGIQE